MAPIVVYLCKGESVLVPDARRVVVKEDKLVCVDERGKELAKFPSREVYRCTQKPEPVGPV